MGNSDNMVKLAEDLLQRVEELETGNTRLQAQLELNKRAAAAPVVAKADEKLIDTVCGHMARTGRIAQDQRELMKQAMVSDPNTAFKALETLLIAEPTYIEKTASEDLSGGTTVGKVQKEDSRDDLYTRMYNTLNP